MSTITSRTVADYCRKRIAPLLPPADVEAIRRYLTEVLRAKAGFPRHRGRYDLDKIAVASGVRGDHLETAFRHLQPVLDAITRSVPTSSRAAAVAEPKADRDVPATLRASALQKAAEAVLARPAVVPNAQVATPVGKAKRVYKKRPIEEFPAALTGDWVDPTEFHNALSLHIKRHGDSVRHLHVAVASDDKATNLRTMMRWATGDLIPRSVESLSVLSRIERRYRLPDGYFKAKLPHQGRAATGISLDDLPPAERRRMAWHLPDDFNTRSAAEQEEILDWVRRVVISGSTDYRAYQAAAVRNRYSVRFRSLQGQRKGAAATIDESDAELDTEIVSSVVDAPPMLEREMAMLLKFKTATLTQFGYRRNGVWGDETASQKVDHLGLLFGSLAASADGPVKGFGAPLDALCFAMLAVPSVWDWYLQWREQRRGFYTKWEVNMLALVGSLVKAETGWLRQNPQLADRLTPIAGLIDDEEIQNVRRDWPRACEEMYRHARQRLREVERVMRVHRDPFEPILPILEAESPVAEYRKITDEILRRLPNERLYPKAAAEAVRAFLMLRIGLHTGLRQKNLRELRLRPRGSKPTAERVLEDMRCGEMRWSDKDAGWEVLIPSVAFKNAESSFFGQKPFRLLLPDMARLYEMIDAYASRHRAKLLGSADDPGTFFVKTVKSTSSTAAYSQMSFYDAWRLAIQRYGIYNPYTKRGAIAGLLPHGPHNVRDVLATHILKKTGSYEQASYAIQDTPEMVRQAYGRFLPEDKAAIAAQVLNRVWS